jgi:dCMP deaminase
MILEHRSDLDWLRQACVAATGSHDPSTQNGAVLVPRSGYVTLAHNSIPAGINPLPGRLDRPVKYDFVEHAERAAIYKAARNGTPTLGARLYCPWFACADCARAIICSGVIEVIGHIRPRAATPERWTATIVQAEAMLREAGVGMRWLAGPVGVTIRFNGEEMRL